MSKGINLSEAMIDTGALLEGHFILSSGLHSSRYIQCARLLQYPELASGCAEAIASSYQGAGIKVVIGPAMGGIVLSYEIARHLNARAIFAERDSSGAMSLRRGFSIAPGENVLVAEDVVTTGKSVDEIVAIVNGMKGLLRGIGCIVDRSGGESSRYGDFSALLKVTADAYPENECPLCEQNIPVRKPGSRK